ncbi:hypothetical protein GOODEAATRI_013569 [Goodea atripinnis]|uniref:Uncharacterized protein n=1 Tax=Goodea atripinnis TaxID=208336 RepID=A0ABV0NUB4_9TELE
MSEFGPEKETDINAVLAEVEESLKQNTKYSNDTQTKTLSQQSAEGIQKKSNKTQHLYRQMCYLEKELSLKGPSSLPSPQSFDNARQQVQRIKSFLEDQLSACSHVHQDEPKYEKYLLKIVQFYPAPHDPGRISENRQWMDVKINFLVPWGLTHLLQH